MSGSEELLSWEEFEARVRAGRIPADAEVRIDAVTQGRFVRADQLELYRSMRNLAALAYEDRFVSGPPPIATALLVGVQIRIWWLARIEPVQTIFVNLGVNFAPAVFDDGQIWRPLTMGILHTDFWHVALNMMWLAYVGWNLERALGWKNLLVLYGASVLGGATLSMFVSPFTPSLGASGGVFGLIAASVVFGFARREAVPLRGQRWFGPALLPYLIVMFWNGWASEQTDNWAHLGGLLTGLVLGLLVEPDEIARDPKRPARLRLAVFAFGLLSLSLLWATGPRLHPLFDSEVARQMSRPRVERSRRPPRVERPLRWSVPGGWRPGSDLMRRPAFVSPDERRSFSVSERSQESARPIADAAAQWSDDLLSRAPDAKLGEPTAVSAGGRQWLQLTATLGEGEEQKEVYWWGSSRGIYEITAIWQAEAPRALRSLSPLRARLLESVSRADPPELLEAEEAYRDNPKGARARTALAIELAKLGEVERAIDLHEGLVREPTDASSLSVRWSDYLSSLHLLGFLAKEIDSDAIFDRALLEVPRSNVVIAVVDGLSAAGEADLARGLLAVAWWRSPGERDVKRARLRREMTVSLDGSEPWDLVHDPTGAPRDPAEIERRRSLPLTREGARLASEALAADRSAGIDAVIDAVSRQDPAGRDPLFILRDGRVPDSDSDATKALIDDLRRALQGTGPDWVPAEIVSALSAHPDYIDRIAVAP